ncbi:MAG: DUF2608 domain-containing protein [Parachlamydiales bacterium]|jgi:hypothetical protein
MKKCFFLFFILLISKTFSEIIEIKNISEISEYLLKADLVVFDLDNTIMENSQQLGSDQWFDYQINLNQKNGLNYQAALSKTLLQWYEIQAITKVNLVEKEVKRIIDLLQNKKIHLMGLTARNYDLAFSTIKQLDSLNIDFQKTSLSKKNIINDEIYYRNGILFANGINKGQVLKNFFSKIKFDPRSIVFC